MNDSEALTIEQETDAATTPTAAPAVPVRPPRSQPTNLVPIGDATLRLVADLAGTTPRKATEILRALGGIHGIAYATEPELRAAAVPPNRARLVQAAFELARLSIGQPPQRGSRLAGSSEVWKHMRARLAGQPVEEFWAIGLDVRHRVMVDTLIARGSLTGVEIHPRDVFRPLIKAGSAAVIFCHNHPSGDPSPSRADVELTTRLREVGDLCGIPVLDHVVVGYEGYASLSERGWR
jgi:DNA repair protein RadC